MKTTTAFIEDGKVYRICRVCKLKKVETEFAQYNLCKLCRPMKQKEYDAKKYLKHKATINARVKNWKDKNKEKFNEIQKHYKEENREKLLKEQKARRLKNIEHCRKRDASWAKEKRRTDLNFRLKGVLRVRIREVLLRDYANKSAKTMDLLGCTIDYFRLHVESKFVKGMTWDNYGKYGWHIDHIIPCNAFDLTKEEEQKKCFHYTNMQPLWAEDNLRKSWKVI